MLDMGRNIQYLDPSSRHSPFDMCHPPLAHSEPALFAPWAGPLSFFPVNTPNLPFVFPNLATGAILAHDVVFSQNKGYILSRGCFR